MDVLVACEESQVVCKAFRARGHRAFSCDIQDCSGGHLEWHIKGDVLPLLNGNCEFVTVDCVPHKQDGRWDLIIAHPPCTYLSRTAQSNPYQKWASEEYRQNFFKQRILAFEFFMICYNSDCFRVAVENPPGYVSTYFRKPNQIIHPWEFGHNVNKPTGLWLKGLPLLEPTMIVTKGEFVTWGVKHKKTISKWYKETRGSKRRSVTFQGIAEAMADQWGDGYGQQRLGGV